MNFPKCRALPAQIKLNDGCLGNNIVYDVDRSLNLVKKDSLNTYALVDSKLKIIRLVNSMTPVDDFMTCEVNTISVHQLDHQHEQLWAHGVSCKCEEVHVVDTTAVSRLTAINTLPFLIPHEASIIDPILNKKEC